MPSIFNEYKPLRNFLRQFDLVSNLIVLWCLSQHIMDKHPLPPDYIVGLPRSMPALLEHIYPWDLDVLARELLLNAGHGGKRSLQRWDDLRIVINYLRRLDELAFIRSGDGEPDVLFELHRIAQRQFPWQVNIGVNAMMRAFKVFGTKTIEEIAEKELGMTARQFLLLGMAVSGHFLKQPGISTNQDYGVLGITKIATRAFFDRMTCTVPQLRADIARRQTYDSDWLYIWNPLEATPLVAFDADHPERVICPIPRYLLRRSSAGLFYDLVKAEGFDNPFGNSFQSYIGEVLRVTCASPPFTILEEQVYHIQRQTLHGVDWILSDGTGHLFIETKTKRLTINARTLTDPAALDKDLSTIAKAVVQHYRNIRDAQSGRTSWVSDGLPLFPLVLTLEDWFMLSPRVNEILDGHIRRFLVEAGIGFQVLDDMPYTIASAHEFEIAAQVIAQAGVAAVMAHKTGSEMRSWSLLPSISGTFRAELGRVNYQLFGNDLLSFVPKQAS